MPSKSLVVKEQNLNGDLSVLEMQCKVSKEGWMYRDIAVPVAV